MIKECRVLSYNKYSKILVFEYEGKPIQITYSLPSGLKNVYVKHDKKNYIIVSKEMFEKDQKLGKDKSYTRVKRDKGLLHEE